MMNDLEKALAALNDPEVKSYVYKGETYSLTKLRDVLIPRLRKEQKKIDEQKRIEEQQKKAATLEAEVVVSGAQKSVADAEYRLGIAKTKFEEARKRFVKGGISEADLNTAEDERDAAQLALDTLKGKTPVTETAAPTLGRPPIVKPSKISDAQKRTIVEETSGKIITSTEQTATDDTGDKTKKDKTVTVAGVGPMNLTANVRAEFVKLFPQFAASFDGGEKEQAFVDSFGRDLVDVWIKVTKGDYGNLETDAEKSAYQADIERTAYGQRTSQAEQDFDFNPAGQNELIRIKKNEITKQYADLQLDAGQLDQIAREAARKNYVGDDLKFAVYSFAYGAKPATAMESELADTIRSAGRAYGYNVSDAELKAALTNVPYNGAMVTEDSIRQKAQRAAKGQYGHLADQIDAGLSLDDIFYNYKAYAARTLGVDPGEIDYVNDPKWAEAFGSKDQGQLSLNDWLYKIKSDRRYGYQYTPQAEKEVADVVMSLEKAFGLRK
jgi:hypothetical protein